MFQLVKTARFWCAVFGIISCLCCLPKRVFAQVIAIEQRVTTFDKLTKTIIPFSASEKPTITIVPQPKTVYLLKELGKGDYEIVFESPVAQGNYTITLALAGRMKSSYWRVLPSMIDEWSQKSISYSRLYYGKRILMRSRLLDSIGLPQEQFKIAYKMGNAPRVTDVPYSQFFVGPCIPASARLCTLDIEWIYPPTKERVVLFSTTTQPDQEAPEIYCNSPRLEFASDSLVRALEKSGKLRRNLSGTAQTDSSRKGVDSLQAASLQAASSQELIVVVKGIEAATDVAFDADNSDPNMSKSIRASKFDIEVEKLPTIDFEAYESKLFIYDGDEIDKASLQQKWKLKPETVRVIESEYHAEEATFYTVLALRVPSVPMPQSRILRGSLRIGAEVKVINRKAGVLAKSYSMPCIVPVNLPYNLYSTNLNPPPSNLPEAQASASKSAQTRPSARKLSGEPICAECTKENTKQSAGLHIWLLTSDALREEVQAAMLAAGWKVPSTPLGKDMPLFLGGRLKSSKKSYDLNFLRLGSSVMARYEIEQFLSSSVLRVLEEPNSAVLSNSTDSILGYTAHYHYKALPKSEQEQEWNTMVEAAYKTGKFFPKTILRAHRYYNHAGFALFEADELTTRRFRETFTPSLPRTAGLESAEKECTNTKKIKELIAEGKNVPQRMIDDGESPQDCEVVKSYYIAQRSLVQIQAVMLLVDMRGNEPSILGAIPIQVPGLSEGKVEINSYINGLNAPLVSGLMNAADLRTYTTKETELDESTKKQVFIKASIEHSPFATMYEYCLDGIKKGTFKDRSRELLASPVLGRK